MIINEAMYKNAFIIFIIRRILSTNCDIFVKHLAQHLNRFQIRVENVFVTLPIDTRYTVVE